MCQGDFACIQSNKTLSEGFFTSRAAAESNGGVSALSLKTFSDFSLMGDF